ncbi:MAG: 23S rRNA (guanosine(2251)-2'-O)-methyltransferase RlmB [Candidatus Izemoplasmatales bacterium]
MSIEIYGRNPAMEILSTDKPVEKAILLEGFDHEAKKILDKKRIPVEWLNKNAFLSRYPHQAQGIVLVIEDYKTYDLDEVMSEFIMSENPTVIMLDGIEDPHNLGAIIRSAEAAGITSIIIPKDRSAKLSATVAKTSAGAIEYVKVIEVTNLSQTIEKLKKAGFWIVGTSLDTDTSYDQIFVDRPVCLIIGSEGKGMKKNLLNHTDLNIKIPMVGKMNSLNASVSAGILIFEILRRKRG